MRSATSSSLRVCAASAICSANPRLFAAGPRSITIGALAVSARCRWLAPCLTSHSRPAPHASAPLHPPASLCIPLHPYLCTRTFARCQRSKTPQPLKDTAIAVYPNARGVPEQAAAAPLPLPRGNGTATHKWHRHTGATCRTRCHYVAELREMAPLALPSVWCAHTAGVHTPTPLPFVWVHVICTCSATHN